MKALKETININYPFYIINLLLIICCSQFLLTTTRAESFIILNSIHTVPLRMFFKSITYFGDGLPIILISLIILLFFKKHRKLAILILIAYAASGIFSQIVKTIVLSPRPKVYFRIHRLQFYLDTFENCKQGFRSFPSGHTVSAFALATVLSNYFVKKHIWPIALLYAILIGYSRIYLAHHFLIDVFIGALIGLLFGSLAPFLQKKIVKLKYWKSFFSWINSKYPNNRIFND